MGEIGVFLADQGTGANPRGLTVNHCSQVIGHCLRKHLGSTSMLAKILAVVVPIIFAFILRESVDHDNAFLHIKSRLNYIDSSPKVLLVTAHPDDESLFFAPTLASLKSSDADVFFLCLSTGDADGLGKVRQQELIQSLDVLGIQDGKRWILDNPYVHSLLRKALGSHF